MHQSVCALKHTVEALIFTPPVIRKATRYDDPAAVEMRHGPVVQGKYKLLANDIVAPRQHDGELVAADTEHGAVLEDVANHREGLADAFVAGLVAKRVVDLFQAIHIADHDGKILSPTFLNGFVEFFLADQISVLALCARQRI